MVASCFSLCLDPDYVVERKQSLSNLPSRYSLVISASNSITLRFVQTMEKGNEETTSSDWPLDRRGNLKIASNDQQLGDLLLHIKSSKTPAVINYGASWCRVCSQILPAFCRLSKNFPKLSFIYADIDECPETTQHIRYTPTFQFFRDGEKVDEMYGAGEDRLYDRLWLHS